MEMANNENILYYINNSNNIINSDSNNDSQGIDLNSLYKEYGVNYNDYNRYNENDYEYNTYNEYITNYTVKQLTHILNYYKLNITRIRKHEMVQLIILFENEPENNLIVNQRQKLWYYINEIKADIYLKKFILFDN
jgi:hypothetical protein